MSKIVVLFELPGMTSKQYDAILQTLKEKGKLFNDQRPIHVSYEKDGAWCVVDVWESEEALERFAKNDLIPAFQKLNLDPPRPQVFPVYNTMGVEEVTSV
jgi:hypothetical protein